MRPYRQKLSSQPVRILVRHADAGPRAGSTGPDLWHGLTPLGRAQSEELAVRLGGVPVLRVLSSPALRCRQTMLPLARELSLTVEASPMLAEEADPARLVRFLRADESQATVLCTHRENLIGLFTLWAAAGPLLVEGAVRMAKAAAWTVRDGRTAPPRLRYLRPLWEVADAAGPPARLGRDQVG